MSDHIGLTLSAAPRWVLAGAAMFALAAPVAIGAVNRSANVGAQRAPDEAFEAASIKPNRDGFIDLGGGQRLLRGETRCHGIDSPPIPGDPLPAVGPGRCAVRNSTVKEMINVAYDLRFGPVRAVLNQMVVGGPSWTETATFDVDAKADNPSVTLQQMHGMLRTLLADRFRLVFHREPRQITGLALVVAKGGHKLTTGDPNGARRFTAAPVVRGQNVPVVTLANAVSLRLGRPVTDETELTGVYDFTLTWTPDPTDASPNGLPILKDAEQSGGSLATALQEQLGLRLETKRITVQSFVIDSIDRPGPN